MEQLDPQGIQQVVKLLNDIRVPDTAVQHGVVAQLQNLNQHPDFNKYLTFIFVTATNDEMLRKTAGLALKNNINLHYSNMGPEVQQYIKVGLLSILGAGQHDIRRTVANNITTIAGKCGLVGWPDLVPTLLRLLASNDPNLVAGTFETLELLCDDLHDVLNQEVNGVRPTNTLIPTLIDVLISAQDPEIQRHCLSCVNQFLVDMPAVLSAEMPRYLQAIFNLATSSHPAVRKHVCHAFVSLIELRPDHMFFQSGISNVIEYMIHATDDADEEVALEACEFWTALCRRQEYDVTQQLLRPYLPRVVALLLSKMVYSQEELDLLDVQDHDAAEADRDEDLRPSHHRSRHSHDEEGEGEEGGDDDDQDQDADPVGWTIRKCSAGGLDNLALVFGEELWPHLQPLLEQRFNSPNWPDREAAVLSLGAVADGCLEGLKPHLSQLLQYLCILLKDQQPLIRSIACWTLSRFSSWLVEQNDPSQFLQPVLERLLESITDSNKRVQQVACSAFATLEDEAHGELIPFLDKIVSTLMFAFQRYQAKNMLILYDAIGTLADVVGSALNQPKYVEAILPPLMNKWATLDLTNKQLLPLLECLTDVAQAMGPGFQPYAQAAYAHALKIIQDTMALHNQARQNPHFRLPELDPIVWSLDLISGICVAIENNIDPIIRMHQPPLLSVIFQCIQDGYGLEVTRQSALALIGDLAKASIDQVRPHLAQLMPQLAANLSPYHVSVCNNSSWAIGEISVRLNPDELSPFVEVITEKLVTIILNRPRDFNSSLLENCAITLGRLGMVVPGTLAPSIGSFLPEWCRQIKLIHDPMEKTHAYRGLVQMVQLNPGGSLAHLHHICDCIAYCNLHNNELHDSFHLLLHMFKSSLGDQWTAFYSQFPDKERAILSSRYRL